MRATRPIMRALVAGVAAVVFGSACGSGGAGGAPDPPADGLVDIGAGLRGPAGLTATVYASGIPRTSALVTDPSGRLWVATAGYQDTGDDAVFVVSAAGDAPVAVIRGLHTPLGLLWLDDELYVASTGGVDAYSGFDGLRFANERSVVTFPAGSGQSDGLVLAPDGRIQLGISAPCDHCVPESEWSASVVSFAPDGSGLRVDASRIRAPIALAYVPGTTDLLVTMNHRDDLGDATPGDWLGLVRPGQDWRFPDCPSADPSGCVGAPVPTAVLDPHAAVSGLAIVTGQFGPAIGTSALVAEWKLGTVKRVSMVADGASGYKTAVTPFLTGLESPMPLYLAADGAVLVGDWDKGMVYRIAAS